MSNAALKSFMTSLSAVTPDLAANWKAQATKNGWDSKLSNSISLAMNSDMAGLYIPPQMEAQVANEEFGNVETGTPPKPALRSFEASSKKSVKSAIYEGLCDYLDSKGLI